MNTEEFEEKIKEYFEYIKTVFINEYGRYMDKMVKSDIKNMPCNIELRDELPYKVHVHENNITFNLDLERFIKENNLEDEENFSDLSEDSKKYVNYLLDNKNDVFEVIKNKLLESFLILFTKNRKDVVTLGTVKMIAESLAKKYNLPNEDIVNSKEKEVALYIKDIVGIDALLCGVISRNNNIISQAFDEYSNGQSYNTFTQTINDIYEKYKKNTYKVYLSDSLYVYEKIDYNLEKSLATAREERLADKKNKLKRLTSIKRSIVSMQSNRFVYSVLEQRKLDDAYNEINSVLSKIALNKNSSIELIDKEYDDILTIEKNIKKLTLPLWNNYLTNVKNDTDNFNYLVSTKITDDVIEAKIISNEMFDKINGIKLNYGFVCYPTEGAIIHASTKSFSYKKNSDKYIISNESESPIQPPNMIVASNINSKSFSNEILLDKTKTIIKGVYCYADTDLENCPNYLKASVLAEDNDLPLIILNQEVMYKSTAKVA